MPGQHAFRAHPGQPGSSTLPLTSTVMIDGLSAAHDRGEWGSFVRAYWPALIGYARRKGICEGDAPDVAQETLLALRRTLSRRRFDRSRGGLRKMVFAIAHRQIVNRFRARGGSHADSAGPSPARPARLPETGLSRVVAARPARTGSGNEPTREWRRETLERCFTQIRAEVSERTFGAFELVALRDVPAARVALDLGMTENAVYGAKRRVLARLRELLAPGAGAPALTL